MKKIMFNDKYGLTQAVLEGRKTMTRRIIKDVDLLQYLNELDDDGALKSINGTIITESNSRYKVCEIVAVAQCYEDAIIDVGEEKWNKIHKWYNIKYLCHEKGLHNKMFVLADLMPHRIRITDIKVERLRDISSEDCLKEGIEARVTGCHTFYYIHGEDKAYNFPKQAFSALIDKVSGKGTWESNPWVFAYEFELLNS